MISIGIDLGGTNIKAALVHSERGILERVSMNTEAEAGKDHVFDRIRQAVDRLLQNASHKPIGIGMGTPGMVTLDRTTVRNPPNLPGWKVVHVSEEIRKRTGF